MSQLDQAPRNRLKTKPMYDRKDILWNLHLSISHGFDDYMDLMIYIQKPEDMVCQRSFL